MKAKCILFYLLICSSILLIGCSNNDAVSGIEHEKSEKNIGSEFGINDETNIGANSGLSDIKDVFEDVNNANKIDRIKKEHVNDNIIAEGENEGVSWVLYDDGVLILEGSGEVPRMGVDLGGGIFMLPEYYEYRRDIKTAYVNLKDCTDFSFLFNRISVESVDFCNTDMSKVTDMSYMFRGCGLENIDLSNFNTSNVTKMVSMFESTKFTELDLSSFDTSNVTAMNMMFANANVTSLDLNNFNTANVKYMTGMFYGCDNLNELHVENFDLSSLEYMDAFYNYRGQAELPSWYVTE